MSELTSTVTLNNPQETSGSTGTKLVDVGTTQFLTTTVTLYV